MTSWAGSVVPGIRTGKLSWPRVGPAVPSEFFVGPPISMGRLFDDDPIRIECSDRSVFDMQINISCRASAPLVVEQIST